MNLPLRRVVALVLVTVAALGFVVLRWSGQAGPVIVPATGTTRATINPNATGTSLSPVAAEQAQVLACLRQNESGDEYDAVSASGEFFGAYQFDQQTWNNTAEHAGYSNLVGVQPNLAAPADQDAVALALLEWQGTWPWNGDPCVS
ncbi:MAG: transglycosylase family protein [Actinobacteria bacterium]|nr:transglycosylase family protein [Actinomycetota bacterium]